MSTQYTIRAIPRVIDLALRRRAKQVAKSLNTVALESLARGMELEARPVEHTDLDDLIGSWQDDPAFDRAVADFEEPFYPTALGFVSAPESSARVVPSFARATAGSSSKASLGSREISSP